MVVGDLYRVIESQLKRSPLATLKIHSDIGKQRLRLFAGDHEIVRFESGNDLLLDLPLLKLKVILAKLSFSDKDTPLYLVGNNEVFEKEVVLGYDSDSQSGDDGGFVTTLSSLDLTCLSPQTFVEDLVKGTALEAHCNIHYSEIRTGTLFVVVQDKYTHHAVWKGSDDEYSFYTRIQSLILKYQKKSQ